MITAVADGEGVQCGDGRPVAWWSFTKTVLAAAALGLVARGRLDLDAPLTGTPATLRQVLQHRGGLADYGSLDAYHAAVGAGEAPWATDDMLARAGADRLLWAPGGRFTYSNVGYVFVRQAIEAAAGMCLADCLTALVLAPLGLQGVRLAVTPGDLDGTAWGNARAYHPGWVYHGLLMGPAGQAALLLHRLLAGDLLPPALLAAMCETRAVGAAEPGRPWECVGYGLGLGICQAPPGLFLGHTGVGPGSVAAVYQLAGSRRTVAVFADAVTPGVVEGCLVSVCSRG